MALDVVFVPHLDLIWIIVLTIATVALVGAALLLSAPAALWSAAAMAGALLVLANHAIVEEGFILGTVHPYIAHTSDDKSAHSSDVARMDHLASSISWLSI